MDGEKLPWSLWAVGFLSGVLFGLFVGAASHNIGGGFALGLVLAVPFAYAAGRAFHRRRP